jgi:hypothetical protein
MTRDRTRTMVLRTSRSIQKHLIGTGCELSYCDMRAAGCALCVIALRSHLTNLFRRVTVWRHVVWRSDVTSWDILTSRFTSRPPAIRHIHINKWRYTATPPYALMVCVGDSSTSGEFCNHAWQQAVTNSRTHKATLPAYLEWWQTCTVVVTESSKTRGPRVPEYFP